MQAKFSRTCSLCLLREEGLTSFIADLRRTYPDVEITVLPFSGTVQLLFQAKHSVDPLIDLVQEQFPTFFYGEGAIEEAVHREFIARKKTLALAESCTGGRVASKLTLMPDASKYFLGSIVAYANSWKERFLQVSHTTLQQRGAVSKEAVTEMVQGLFSESDADYAVAVSGIAGPGGGSKEKPVGTMYVAIGERGGKIDAGVIHAPTERKEAIELAVNLILGALWRRLVHKTATFS